MPYPSSRKPLLATLLLLATGAATLGAPRRASADACCLANLCFDVPAMLCTAAGGTPEPPGTLCEPFPCGGPGPYGACCVAAADACGYGGQFGCLAVMGTYQGNGTTCSPSPCPTAPTGACCTTQAGCVEITLNQCDLATGVYQGDGTTCIPDPCTPTCDLPSIVAILRVLAVRTGATRADISFGWTPDPAASGYDVWYVTGKRQIPARMGSPGVMSTGCIDVTGCVHTGAVGGPAGTLFYYNVLGVCNGSEAPV